MIARFHRSIVAAGRLRAPAHRFTIAAAWYFIAFSLAHLSWVIAVKWGDPGGLTTLYQTTVADETVRAWGLAYRDTPGLLLALFQALLVGAAAVFTLLPSRTHRRLGHLVLVGWALLWMVDLMSLAAFDHRADSIAQSAALVLLFGCTTYRAVAGWSSPRKVHQVRPDGMAACAAEDHQCDAGADTFGPDHVSGSDRVREITDHYRETPGALRSRLGPAAAAARGASAKLGQWTRRGLPRLHRCFTATASCLHRAKDGVIDSLRRNAVLAPRSTGTGKA